jgi:tRNA-2-methylthio-N6-dimethylallyladenosine synthase
VPGVSITTDLIVGFPGETEAEYENSVDLLRELKFDKVHCAAYSTRPGTTAYRTMDDNVPHEEKKRRLKEVDNLQQNILKTINASLVGENVEVMIEGRKQAKWQSRTRTDKIVFFESDNHQIGDLATVTISSATAWSLQGTLSVV